MTDVAEVLPNVRLNAPALRAARRSYCAAWRRRRRLQQWQRQRQQQHEGEVWKSTEGEGEGERDEEELEAMAAPSRSSVDTQPLILPYAAVMAVATAAAMAVAVRHGWAPWRPSISCSAPTACSARRCMSRWRARCGSYCCRRRRRCLRANLGRLRLRLWLRLLVMALEMV